jgi:uncharacterized integral membrane protein
MATLLITALTSIIFGVIATQNTTLVDLRLGGYSFSQVPVYVVSLGSLIIGVLLAALVHLAHSLSSFFTIHHKESQIRETESTVRDLEAKIRDLEIENARLRGETGETLTEKVEEQQPHPNFFDRLRHNLSTG